MKLVRVGDPTDKRPLGREKWEYQITSVTKIIEKPEMFWKVLALDRQQWYLLIWPLSP